MEQKHNSSGSFKPSKYKASPYSSSLQALSLSCMLQHACLLSFKLLLLAGAGAYCHGPPGAAPRRQGASDVPSAGACMHNQPWYCHLPNSA